MKRLIIIAALLLPCSATAADAPAPKPTVEKLQEQIAQLNAIVAALVQQRNDAQNQAAQYAATISVQASKPTPTPQPEQGK